MRNKLMIALLITLVATVFPGFVFMFVDEHRPPTVVAGAGARLVWFLPLIAGLVWCAFRALKALRRKETINAAILPCVILLCIAFNICAGVAFLNHQFHGKGVAVAMVVTDVFVLHREDHHDERLVTVSLPDKMGGTAVWQVVDPKTSLTEFPLGSEAIIIWHNGYFGNPWCDYVDHRFPQYRWQLMEYYKNWRAISAVGQFSAGSPYKKEMISWGIPVTEVANLKELSAADQ